MASVQVPHNFVARPYQKDLYNCITHGKKRAVVVWHRRAGKDKVFMAILAREAFKRVGTYFYMLPYYKQARSVIWEGMDGTGFKMLDHIPSQLVKRVNNQEMVMELVNGSVLRFVGSDNVDSIVGTNPVGILFSEYSLHKPGVWGFMEPILLENGGFALFNGTPRGKNHLYDLYTKAEESPDWFTQTLSIDKTGAINERDIETIRRNGTPEAIIKQEYYCSFDAALMGAYYEDGMNRMAMEGRITDVPWEPDIPVKVAWDLGMSDTMIAVCYQCVGRYVHIIDVIADNGKALEYYVKKLNEKPYAYEEDIYPHDVKVRELATGKSRLQTLVSLGRHRYTVATKSSVDDGINVVRGLLGRVLIDRTRCKTLVEALKSYRKDWDEVKKVYGDPIHDWASHYADAIRTLAVAGIRDKVDVSSLPEIAIGVDESPFSKRTNHANPGWDYRDHIFIEDSYSRRGRRQAYAQADFDRRGYDW